MTLKRIDVILKTYLWLVFYLIYIIVRDMRKFLKNNLEYVILAFWFIIIGLVSIIVTQ